jgi:hypothetical protein
VEEKKDIPEIKNIRTIRLRRKGPTWQLPLPSHPN